MLARRSVVGWTFGVILWDDGSMSPKVIFSFGLIFLLVGVCLGGGKLLPQGVGIECQVEPEVVGEQVVQVAVEYKRDAAGKRLVLERKVTTGFFGRRELGAEDQAALRRAMEMVIKGKPSREQVGDMVYEVSVAGNEVLLWMGVKNDRQELNALELAMVVDAMDAAMAAEEWYGKLQEADAVPQEEKGAKPPVVAAGQVSYLLDGLREGDWQFRLVVRDSGGGYKPRAVFGVYEEADGKQVYHEHEGPWVDMLMEHAGKAAVAMKQGKDYVYKRQYKEPFTTGYSILSNKGKGVVELSCWDQGSKHVVELDAEGMRRLQELYERAEKVAEWARENEALFFKRKPKLPDMPDGLL